MSMPFWVLNVNDQHDGVVLTGAEVDAVPVLRRRPGTHDLEMNVGISTCIPLVPDAGSAFHSNIGLSLSHLLRKSIVGHCICRFFDGDKVAKVGLIFRSHLLFASLSLEVRLNLHIRVNGA